MKKCVLYMRMSTDKQENSIESQKKVLFEYANRHNLDILKMYVEDRRILRLKI